MATSNQPDLADKIAMWGGGGLIFIGVVVMGLLTTLAGSMSALYTIKKGEETVQALSPSAVEGGTVVTAPLFDPNLRATIIALGMVILAVYAVYTVVTGE